MATTFAFKFVTPTGVLFDGQAEQVNAVNPLGEFGVLADHTNYITSLEPGLLTIRTAEGQTLAYLVTGGLVEVKDGAMTALASTRFASTISGLSADGRLTRLETLLAIPRNCCGSRFHPLDWTDRLSRMA